jgi:hypothetical protein
MMTHTTNFRELAGCLFPTSHNYLVLSFYNHTIHTTGYCTILILKGSEFDSNASSQLKTQFCAGHGYKYCFLFCAFETDVAKRAIRLTMFVRLFACSSSSPVLSDDGLFENPIQIAQGFQDVRFTPPLYFYRLCMCTTG